MTEVNREEANTNLALLDKAADMKATEFKDPARKELKDQADKTKLDALKNFRRGIRNDYLDDALNKIDEALKNGSIKDELALRNFVDSEYNKSESDPKFQKIRDAKSISELQAILNDPQNAELVNEFFTARAMNYLINMDDRKNVGMYNGDRLESTLAGTLFISNEVNNDSPFTVWKSNNGQALMAGKSDAFAKQIEKILENVNAEGKAEFVTALAEKAKNATSPNDLNGFISESTNDMSPYKVFAQYLTEGAGNQAYQEALNTLESKEVKEMDKPQIFSLYIERLRSRLDAHMNIENNALATWANGQKSKIEALEYKPESQNNTSAGNNSSNSSAKEKVYKQRVNDIFNELSITDGQDIVSAYVELSISTAGMSETIKPQNNIHKANDLFDWLEKATKVTLTYTDTDGKSIKKDFFRNTSSNKLEAAKDEPQKVKPIAAITKPNPFEETIAKTPAPSNNNQQFTPSPRANLKFMS